MSWCVIIELDSKWTAALDALNEAPEQSVAETDQIREIARTAIKRDDPPPRIVAVAPRMMMEAFCEASAELGFVRRQEQELS